MIIAYFIKTNKQAFTLKFVTNIIIFKAIKFTIRLLKKMY